MSVRTLVGAGMAELFVPKLRDAFTRKGIVSVSIFSPGDFALRTSTPSCAS